MSANGGETPGLVTIVVPIFKRLEYLPGILEAIASQDYQHIDLLVSDNGNNGSTITEIIDRHYGRPYRFRQTRKATNIAGHYHEVLPEAKGEYFLWLADDDLVSTNFVSELVGTLESHPEAAVAIARQAVIDATGKVLSWSAEEVPRIVSGEEFVHSWTKYGYVNYSTVLARTENIRACGGWGMFQNSTGCDDALLLRLCLRGSVAFNTRCVYQYRWHETSFGLSITPQQLAEDVKSYLGFLESDPILVAYASQNPQRWGRMKKSVVEMMWGMYLDRWRTIYRRRLPLRQWVRAAFAMPLFPGYYRIVGAEVLRRLTSPPGPQLDTRR